MHEVVDEDDLESLALSSQVQELLNNNKRGPEDAAQNSSFLLATTPPFKKARRDMGTIELVPPPDEDEENGDTTDEEGDVEILRNDKNHKNVTNEHVLQVMDEIKMVLQDEVDTTDNDTDDIECLLDDSVMVNPIFGRFSSCEEESNPPPTIKEVIDDENVETTTKHKKTTPANIKNSAPELNILPNKMEKHNKLFIGTTERKINDASLRDIPIVDIENEDDFVTEPEKSDMKKCFVSITKTPIPAHISQAAIPASCPPKPVSSPCQVCQQLPDRVLLVEEVEGAVGEAVAVKDHRISVVSWEDAVRLDFPPSFKALDVSIHDEFGHLVLYDQGLVESGHQLYFSGLLTNILDDEGEQVRVEGAGPLTSWRRHEGEEEGDKLVLTTDVEGLDTAYHINLKDLNVTYKTAIQRLTHYRTFSDALSAAMKIPTPPPSARTSPVSSRRPSRMSEERMSECSEDSWAPSPSVKKTQKSRRKRSTYGPSESDLDSRNNGGGRDTDLDIVLRSLGHQPGIGSRLRSLSWLANEEEDTLDGAAAFLLFVRARQEAWVNKHQGTEPFTTNKVIQKQWFTNIYRELDRGTAFFKMSILPQLRGFLKSGNEEAEFDLVKDVLFKSIVYRLINKIETFARYGKLPAPEDFTTFLKWLGKERDADAVIFTAAHQNMGFRRLMDTFAYLRKNIKNLTEKVMKASQERSIRKVQETLLTIPNVGNFFAWQILCDLCECRLLGKCTDNQWTCLGPGAKSGLRRIFTMESTKHELKNTRLLRDLCAPSGNSSGFSALGLTFPSFLNKRLSLKNVEHGLCEFDKYFRYAVAVPNKARSYTEETTRRGLDREAECNTCENTVGDRERLLCPTCYRVSHSEGCAEKGGGEVQEGVWLCGDCVVTCEQWDKEDFEFDEVDPSDELGKVWKHPAAARNEMKERKENAKAKAKQKVKKVRNDVECITLSSDEEEEEGEEEDDEVEFLTEMEGHFFGYNSGEDPIGVASESERDEDPFADVECWVDTGNCDDIIILS